jgi:Abortive infection C-terminus
VPPQLQGVPDMLDRLLKRSGALRNTMSDSHGKASGAPQVPQELVDLAIHWAGAFIVYLSRAVPRSS